MKNFFLIMLSILTICSENILAAAERDTEQNVKLKYGGTIREFTRVPASSGRHVVGVARPGVIEDDSEVGDSTIASRQVVGWSPSSMVSMAPYPSVYENVVGVERAGAAVPRTREISAEVYTMAGDPTHRQATGEIYVVPKKGSNNAELEALFRDLGVQVKERRRDNSYVVQAATNVVQKTAALQANPAVDTAETDFRVGVRKY